MQGDFRSLHLKRAVGILPSSAVGTTVSSVHIHQDRCRGRPLRENGGCSGCIHRNATLGDQTLHPEHQQFNSAFLNVRLHCFLLKYYFFV